MWASSARRYPSLGAPDRVCYRPREPPGAEGESTTAVRHPMTDPSRAHADVANLFTASLVEADPEIADVIKRELSRQRDEIELIASENIVSKAVLEAQGSLLTNKYAAGLPGRWFKPVAYGVRRDDHRIDFDEVAKLAREHRPKVIIAGGSAYPRFIDFRRFREIADEVGAKLLVDMAHFAGLVAGGAHPSPFPYAHVVTSTAHKTLRGPRSGFTLTNDEELAKKLNAAVFPGLQGGPLMHVIAAKAVAFGEALRPAFKLYARNVVANAKALADRLKSNGLDIVSGGTDTHLMLVDLRPKRLTGKVAEAALERAHITCNKNGIPFDPEKPTVTSGIRLGTPAGTTRGFGIAEFRLVGELITEVLDVLSQKGADADSLVEGAVREKVKRLISRFRIYPD